MTPPPRWFTALAVLGLLWNLLGLLAVVAELRLSAAEIAAMAPAERALREARPDWSVWGGGVAVAAGVLGSLGLLLRRRWAVLVLGASIAGLVVQDIGAFGVAAARSTAGAAPLALQGLVLVIACGLLALARRAAARSWLT